MNPFEFVTAQRIIYGAGKLTEVGAIAGGISRNRHLVEGARAGTDATERVPSRVLVVIGKSARAVQHAEPLLRQLDEYATFSVSGEPTFDVVRTGTQRARDEQCDVVISFGGGSVIDAGKAIAMLLTNGGDPLDYAEVIGRGLPVTKPSAPFIAIPTTAGTGAEVTRNAVLGSPEHHVKVSLRSPLMLPAVALVDPEISHASVACRLDALSQLIEAFVSVKANPLTDIICREGMQQWRAGEFALAALYSGMALTNAGLGAVHGFAGPLGGMYDTPARRSASACEGASHGALCAALLRPVFEMNSKLAPNRERFEEVERIVGDWSLKLEIKTLRELGVRQLEFPAIIEKAKASSSMKGNPVVLTDAQLREILERAW